MAEKLAIENFMFSIVVITKNEEKNIERCLKSIKQVFTELNYLFEIILVDSNSTDSTLKKAIDLKIDEIKILKITQATTYNAALGRNIGSNIATGKYLLFLDGDMKLYKDFLLYDFEVVNEEKCAGVIGIRNDVFLNSDDEVISYAKNKYNISKKRIAPHFGGALLITRKIFNEVGGYRNYINSSEEPEFYIRLKSKGYKIYEVPQKMIDHYDKLNNKVEKAKSLLFSERGLGLGQTISSSLKDKNTHYLFTHKAVSQLFIPLLLDVFSYFFLLLSLININYIFVFILIQVVCFIICLLVFDIKKIIISKLIFIPTIIGIFKKKENEYTVKSIK